MRGLAERRYERIILVTHYFPPERNAPARRISELARHWSARGRHVEVITGMPNHPYGVLPPEYRGAWYRRESHDGAVVHRGRIYPAANSGIWRRALNYLSFCLSAVLTGLFRAGPADCVIATSPQLFCALAGWVLSVFKRAPFIFEVRDIWPEEIVAVGAIRNRIAIHLLEGLEMFLYHRARRIVAVAHGTVEILTARGIPSRKITVVPNGVDTSTFVPGPVDETVREQHNLNGEFLVSYIGTVGMAHRLDVMLDAAARLSDNPHIRFLIVGDGAERQRLEHEAQRRGLDNLIWAESQPANRVAAYYRASDACVVHLRRARLFTKNIPSKMYEIMACGRPILLGTEGESRQLGERSGGALPFAPESATDLAEAIGALARDRERAREMGRAGREFVTEHFDRRQLSDRYLDLIDRMTDTRLGTLTAKRRLRQDPAHAEGTLHSL
ncbi:MAG TPA: glycosyltransferase family 4 protein [Acidobacteriota bacterium]|nr:glycosyltransferase family 4 protein [Acidobacteriota bacterium]